VLEAREAQRGRSQTNSQSGRNAAHSAEGGKVKENTKAWVAFLSVVTFGAFYVLVPLAFWGGAIWIVVHLAKKF